jgi:16S rRNA (cytidine1402-2'-O)-methyltransferase
MTGRSGEGVAALGVLYVVSSPLGNPADLSPRAVSTLADADVIFAEDTRTARVLMRGRGIDKPLHSCFDANEPERAAEAAAFLRQGKAVALVSEAGTPAVSDPGFRLVRAAIDAGARVIPVPGPSALLAALVASGLPPDRFFFAGFPPRKRGPRRALFEGLKSLPATLIFYESPHRVPETLADLEAVLGAERPACLARELTKTHEEIVRDSLGALASRYRDHRPLGEVTLVVGGATAEGQREQGTQGKPAEPQEQMLSDRAASLLAAGRSPRDVADILATEAGRRRRDLYKLVLRVAAQGTRSPAPPQVGGSEE